jgi:GntR family transcriptional regulator
MEPVYIQLAGILRGQIAKGAIKPGERLPSETELMEKYGVARLTARRAYRELANEGLTITVQGRGSFVKDSQEPEGK